MISDVYLSGCSIWMDAGLRKLISVIQSPKTSMSLYGQADDAGSEDCSECIFETCMFKLSFLLNVFEQSLQTNGRSLECLVILCLWRPWLCEKLALQCLHLWDFCFSWMDWTLVPLMRGAKTFKIFNKPKSDNINEENRYVVESIK